jgi:Leucine-rich repeat (LRR) protein
VINLSGNAIARIPTVRLPSRRFSRTGGTSGGKQQPQLQQHRRLSVVDLSDNALVKFPQQLLTLVRDRLDVSRNQIATVPLSMERKLSSRDSSNDKNSGRGRREGATAELVMSDNPVVCPPEDVCRCGMRAILNYLREAKAHLPTYQGLKVWSNE